MAAKSIITVADGCEHPGADAFGPGDLARQKLVGYLFMDIFGVDNVDAVGVLTHQLNDVGTATGQMASVQAQPDRGVLEHADHFVTVLDHRSPMGV